MARKRYTPEDVLELEAPTDCESLTTVIAMHGGGDWWCTDGGAD